MFDDMMEQISDWTDEEEVGNHLRKLLHKEAFDKAGLIYGVGHAIYSKSDPRAEIFRSFVEKLSEEKGCKKEFALYSRWNGWLPKSSRRNARCSKVSASTWTSIPVSFTKC